MPHPRGRKEHPIRGLARRQMCVHGPECNLITRPPKCKCDLKYSILLYFDHVENVGTCG